MKHVAPPTWMQVLLHCLLPLQERETVGGDLYEEFRETKVAELGSTRAKFWYFRQVVSFAPRRFRSALVHPRALAVLCAFTLLCGSWLGIMDLVLRHPAAQLAIAGFIASQAGLTLLSLRLHLYPLCRYLAMAGCLALFWLAAKALYGVVSGANVEGYILIIGVALIIQGILTLGTLSAESARDGRMQDSL